ncbi:tetracycline resistance protein [Nitzschia inconspicua]|uniref:Tetracycline resistance protein n=1 Tax=Nitzschia inconspicua TaxID=303405 RepID=A0A9K3KG76_9STRA|nr:tetracycline resistance protein [Nitzschia inconspicua]
MASHESTSTYNSNENDQEDHHHLLIPTTTTTPSPASSSQSVEFVKSPTTTITDETMESIADETHPQSQTSRNISSWFNTTMTGSTTSTTIPSSIQQIDINERPPRPSVYRRQSFIEEFVQTRGPPQIAGLMILIAIGLGCTIGVVPAVMTNRFARLNHGWEESAAACSTFQQPHHNVPAACVQGSADAQTAVATSNLISNVLTFLTSSLLGSWSDRHGRKPLLIAGMAVGAIPPFLLWLMQLLPTMSPWWYYSFHASTGMINWVAVAFSALADVLPPSMRAPGIGLLMAGFMLGFSLAPVLALLLTSSQLSFVSFATVVTGLVCTILYVPETLSPELASEARRKRRQQEEEENEAAVLHTSNESTAYRVVCSIFHNVLLRPFQEMSILNRNTFFRLISSLAFFSGMVSSGDQILLVYYLEERLGFTNQDVSVMFLVVGIMGLVAQGLLLKPLNDLLGEKNVVALAFLCGALDNAMYGLARNKTTIFVALGVAGLTGMAFPTISAIKANNVEPSEQGRIQGALYSLQALASGLGPVSLKFVYSQTKHTKVGPGSMFLFASGLYLVAVCIACSLPNDKANAARCRDGTATAVPSSQRQHMNNDDDEEYMQLASDSSFSDEDDYGTMESTTDAATASTRTEKRTNKGRQRSAV